jgi:TRAP-type C4-dicarboxylate transport system substrate-binding protein
MRNAVREAVAWQRDVHETEETEARKAIEAQGCKITELTPNEHAAFGAAVACLRAETGETLGLDLLAVAAA